jgi:hypothetical protein
MALREGAFFMVDSEHIELFANAIPIFALDSVSGIAEQNEHLSRLFGQRGIDWEKSMSGLSRDNGFWFDCVYVCFKGRRYVVRFDITPLMVMQARELEIA